MKVRKRYFAPLFAATFLALPAPYAVAQVTDLDLRLPWDIDAESTSFDGKTSMIVFTGLRLSQGRISIEANEGRATNTEGESGSWKFDGNVIIDIENGRIECDSADLTFVQYQLRQAAVAGSPATFELKRPGTSEVTYAEAGILSYDVEAGVIEFSDQASINEGGNQISSEYLVYNIGEQRITADSSGSQDGRVRITYTPPDAGDSAAESSGDLPNTESEDDSP